MTFTPPSRFTRVFQAVQTVFFIIAVALYSGAAAPAASAATVFGSNLIVNGDAESAAGSSTGDTVPSIPGWNTESTPFTVVLYGAPDFIASTDPGPKERGKNFFAGGPSTASSKAAQTIDVSSGALAIDTGKTEFLLSGWLGGYSNQEDNAVLTVVFYNESKTKTGSAVIGPATAADRNDATGLVYKETSAKVPAETRSIGVTLVMTRTDGTYDDGYADDLGLVLTAPPPIATTTSLTASATQVAAGSAVTLTALVTPASGSTTPSGTVTFKMASTVLGTVTLNGTGQATLTTSVLPIGTDSVIATYNASLISSASTSKAITVTVTAAAALTLTPASLTFPETASGATSATQPVTLRNTGKTTAAIGSVSLTGAQADDFTLKNACGTSLAAGSSCTMEIAFKPVSTGAKSAKLSVTDSVAGLPQTVALSGTGGAASSAPEIELSATSLTFANQAIKTSSLAKTVTLTNSGAATLNLSSIALSGGQADDFALTKTCGSTLARGASCTLSITFKPVSTGTKVATITIADNASGSPQLVQLSGTGIAATGAPAAKLSATSVKFASQKSGTSSAAQSVTLTNSGTAVLTLNSIMLAGAQADDYTLKTTCGTSLAAGANCTLSVTFEPVSTGTKVASIAITDTASGSPQSVALSGTGS